MSRTLLVFSGILWLSTAAVPSLGLTLTAPAQVPAGAEFEVSWSEIDDPADFITIVPVDKPEGQYGDYKYAKKGSATFSAPEVPGAYEIRYLSKGRSYPTLARRPIEITPVSATIDGPESVESGGTIDFTWTGPANRTDFITVVEAGAREGAYGTYVYTKRGSPAQLVVPEKSGAYELRYLTGKKYRTLASHSFSVTDVIATLEGPASVVEGSVFEVQFSGTGNERDFITIVAAEAAEGQYGDYAYARGSAAELRAPETAGSYELRYLTSRLYRTLARQAIEVTTATASLDAPAEVVGGERFPVEWSGIGNDFDYITIVEPGAEEGDYGEYAYIRRGNPVQLRAPLLAGDYELRYALGTARKTIARRPIRVRAPANRPGKLKVARSSETGALALPPDAAVEVILDASGSMLQRHDGERRIDLAKRVLSDLINTSIPAGTPFAMRVFGHREADSCRTDLEISLSPLAPKAASAQIAGIEAKNLAKTPIARSLELVAEDLASAARSSVVVLVTDGEETCDGDPAKAVEALRAQGFDIRVNIVGFAIDDEGLRSKFHSWASLGGGVYHDAASADDLADSIRRSLRARFVVLDGAGEQVGAGTVGGEAVELPAGTFRVRVEGHPDELAVTIQPDDLITIDLAQSEG